MPLPTNKEIDEMFDEKFPKQVEWERYEGEIDSIKTFISKNFISKAVLVEKIKEENKWATEAVTEREDTQWKVHYAGYKEAITNVLDLITNL